MPTEPEAAQRERRFEVGQRVLVTSVEEAGQVTVDFGDGAYYVRLDSGATIACGREVLVLEEGS